MPGGYPRTEAINRIPISPQWEFDYGLTKPYRLPIHCEWDDFTDWDACTELWYSSTLL